MVGPNARNGVGPHLNELFGRKAGAVENYRYSKDMARAGFVLNPIGAVVITVVCMIKFG